MTLLDLDALAGTPLQRSPFDHVVLPDFVRPEALPRISSDFPQVPGPGSHPPSELPLAGAFKHLIDDLLGPQFKAAIENKFEIDLSNRPVMYTVRGFVAETDGAIHADSKTKIITALLYLNERWDADGGRLRILRSRDDLDDYATEIPPCDGTLLAFRRSDHSWHGHRKHVGPRRVIQLNWVTDQKVVDREQNRHGFSNRLKKAALGLFGAQPASRSLQSFAGVGTPDARRSR
jgi:SM-20-related protein